MLYIKVSGLLPGVIIGSKPTFQDYCLSLRLVIIHPEEGTNSSPETSVYYQEWRRLTTQKPLYKTTTTAKAFNHTSRHQEPVNNNNTLQQLFSNKRKSQMGIVKPEIPTQMSDEVRTYKIINKQHCARASYVEEIRPPYHKTCPTKHWPKGPNNGSTDLKYCPHKDTSYGHLVAQPWYFHQYGSTGSQS
jgi:hypothetical protein